MGALAELRPKQSLEARYAALIRVSKAISSQRGSKELFRTLARELRDVVKFDFISVTLYDEKSNTLRSHALEAVKGPGFVLPPDFPPEQSITWWIYHHQQPVVVPFSERETRFPLAMNVHKKFGVRSSCLLPLTTVHRRLGAISFGSGRPDAFSSEEIRFLSLVAEQVAVAIDDALNFEALQLAQTEVQRQNERLQLILELTNRFVSNLELKDLLRAVSASVRRVMQCDAVGVALPDAETPHLQLFAFDFPESSARTKEQLLIKDEGLAEVLRTRKLWVGTFARESGFHTDGGLTEGLKTGCVLPLVARNRVLGILFLGRCEQYPFTRAEVEFLEQVANQVAIAVENAMTYGHVTELKDKLAQEKLYLESEIRSELNFDEIIGKSTALRDVLRQVETVGPTLSTVLIYGETGTGKELIARAVHSLSPRRSNAFVKLNCASIATGLLESELFGHEKGAFTGAIAQRIGRFELASHGTVFLDEIGEIPLEMQPKLLRVLQEKEFERLGSTRTVRTDVRLIAATSHDLLAMVGEQKFRSDLFFRLNVFPVHLPPLRERPDDIPLLACHFAQQFARRMSRPIGRIPDDAMNALTAYHWPGNVRELQNVIERAVILSSGSVLKVEVERLKAQAGPIRENANHIAEDLGQKPIRGILEDVERQRILSVLEQTRWIVSGPRGAAVRLGMNRSTLQFHMRKLGIFRKLD